MRNLFHHAQFNDAICDQTQTPVLMTLGRVATDQGDQVRLLASIEFPFGTGSRIIDERFLETALNIAAAGVSNRH